MISHARNTLFENSAQRVVYAYLTSLAACQAQVSASPVSSTPRELEDSANQLRLFLQGLYENLYLSPEAFGLPVSPDMCIQGDENDPKQFKQDVKKHLDKPKTLIERGMDFLLLVGAAGVLNDSTLLVDQETYARIVKDCKLKKPFLRGFAEAGLSISDIGEQVKINSAVYPAMFPAYKSLAGACRLYADPKLGRFHFARGDLRALDGEFTPSALELYAIFDPIDFERLSRLHSFFTDLNYKPVFQIYGIYGWEVQYQGPAKIKSSPLVRVEYAQRYKVLLQVFIKCASVNRILDLVYQQPRFLQDDFSHRVIDCNGDACGWCHDKKGLGPSAFTFDGRTRSICWYHYPGIPELNEDSLRLIQQYARMHESLAVSA